LFFSSNACKALAPAVFASVRRCRARKGTARRAVAIICKSVAHMWRKKDSVFLACREDECLVFGLLLLLLLLLLLQVLLPLPPFFFSVCTLQQPSFNTTIFDLDLLFHFFFFARQKKKKSNPKWYVLALLLTPRQPCTDPPMKAPKRVRGGRPVGATSTSIGSHSSPPPFTSSPPRGDVEENDDEAVQEDRFEDVLDPTNVLDDEEKDGEDLFGPGHQK